MTGGTFAVGGAARVLKDWGLLGGPRVVLRALRNIQPNWTNPLCFLYSIPVPPFCSVEQPRSLAKTNVPKRRLKTTLRVLLEKAMTIFQEWEKLGRNSHWLLCGSSVLANLHRLCFKGFTTKLQQMAAQSSTLLKLIWWASGFWPLLSIFYLFYFFSCPSQMNDSGQGTVIK